MTSTKNCLLIGLLFKSVGTKLGAAVVATLAAMAVSLILTPGVAHAYQVHISITGGGQVTETTPANLVGSGCVTSANNPTGTVGKDCYAGTLNGDYGWNWDVDYLATPKPGYQFVQWQSDGNPNPVICDRSTPAATTSTYTGTACKFRTFDNLQTRAVFADTTAPPSPSITGMSPQSGYTNGAITFSFSTSSDPTFKGYQCSIDSQSAWQSCSSGQSFTANEGNHTLYVRSIDWSGNTSFGTASQTWTVDKTAPDTTLDPSVGPGPDSMTQDNDPVFSFSSNESGSTFECNLTGPGLTSTSFTPCNSSPNTSTTRSYTNLKDGTYTFKVKAVDRAGNKDDTPASRTWTIQNAPTVLDDTSLEPDRGATDVPRNTDVSATFSEEMNGPSLKETDNTSKTFKLQQYNKKKKTWRTIPATISLSNTNKTATLDPYGATEPTGTDTLLAANKKFRAIITTGAEDAEGYPMTKQFIWTFTTGDS